MLYEHRRQWSAACYNIIGYRVLSGQPVQPPPVLCFVLNYGVILGIVGVDVVVFRLVNAAASVDCSGLGASTPHGSSADMLDYVCSGCWNSGLVSGGF